MIATGVLALTAILTFIYIVLIQLYTYWFKKMTPFKPSFSIPITKFSVVIPARNEEGCIRKCVESILKGTYSPDMYEIIVMDDHSDDNTAAVVKELQLQYANVQVLELSSLLHNQRLNAYKKKAV